MAFHKALSVSNKLPAILDILNLEEYQLCNPDGGFSMIFTAVCFCFSLRAQSIE